MRVLGRAGGGSSSLSVLLATSAVGLAMIDAGGAPVDAAYLSSGVWEVDIAGTRYPAMASMKPLYDPEQKRIKS